MLRPTPTPDCIPATGNWPFVYSPKLRQHRRALATSASLAALLCAATLMPQEAQAACPAPDPVTKTITVTPSTTACTSISFGSYPNGTNLIVEENASMINMSGSVLLGTAVTKVGNITINGTMQSSFRALNFNPGTVATQNSIGAITFGSKAIVTDGNILADLRNVARLGPITNDGNLSGPVVFSLSGVSNTNAGFTMNGGLQNNGSGTSTLQFLEVVSGTIKGNVINAGSITTTGTGTAFLIRGTIVEGDVENTKTMAGTRGNGIFTGLYPGSSSVSSIEGSIRNSGRIEGYATGISVRSTTVGTSTKGGDVSNAGVIDTTTNGIALTDGGTLTRLLNSGSITAGTAGIFASGSWTVRDSISNSGTISVSSASGVGIMLTGTTVNGNITNSNNITAGSDGVSLTGTTLRGGILNTGTVSAGRFGFALANAGAISTFDNFGTISGTTSGISATGSTQIGTLTNAQGAGNAAGGVTYSGTLPTNYHTVIDGTAYGQLFADPATLTGTTTFAISPLSGTVLAQTYSTVLTGVSAANLSNPDQKVYLFGERGSLVLERQAGSDTTWDLVLKGIWTPFIGWDYPDVDPTVAAMASNREAINRIFAERSAALSAAAQYDCDRFDVHGICVEIAGRATTLDGEAETAAVFNAAARLTPTLRMGFYLDQQASQTDSMVASGPGSVQQDYDMPLFGAYLGYAAAEDGTGLKARASAGYMAGKLDIRRGFLTQSEPASGSAALEAFYAQATLGYGFLIGRDMRLTPYVGLDYTALDRDGYSEAYDASETLFPVTYDSYHDRLLSGLAGVELEGQFNEDVGYRAALGLAFDLTRDANGYGGHSEIPGLETIDLGHDGGSRAEVRPTGLAELFFDPAPNQRISATAFAAQDAWSEDLQATGMIAYRFSF
jgi:hypothetical protein